MNPIRLKLNDQIRVKAWMENSRERLTGTPSTVAAKMCESELELTVTPSNLKHINKECDMGLFITHKKRTVAANQGDIAYLAGVLAVIKMDLGITIPEPDRLAELMKSAK